MAREAARALRRDDVDPARPLAALGLDSLAAVELAAAVAAATGVLVPLDDLFADGMSLAGLAAAVRAAGRGSAPAAQIARGPTGGPADEPGEHPLSAGQRALWLADRLAPESAPYNLAAAARVLGDLDVAAFRRAWERLAERHPALRTSFEERGGEPLRRVHARLPFDLVLAPAPTSAEALPDLLAAAAWEPFDLARGPLLRVRLWPLGEGGHALLVAVHHLIADFHSLAVLFRELAEVYRAERSGAAADLGPAPPGYGAFVRWQEERLAGAEGEKLWEHWRRRLAGELPVLDLPADRPRPPVQTWVGLSRRRRLDAAAAGRLHALAREGGATLYMVLLAGFTELLSRYGAARGTPIGTPVAGRSGPPGIAGAVGYFVNPLVMRVDGSGEPGEPTVAERLRRVRATALDAFEHQDLPFALLAERLRPQRDPSRPPLVQAMLVLQRTGRAEERGLAALALGDAAARVPLADLALSPLPIDRERAPFDLTLTAAESGDGLLLALQANAALFDAPTCGRMLDHLAALLAGMGEGPGRAIASLDLLSAAEREELAAWNETAAPLPEGRTVHDLFAAQAARTPEAVAVLGGGRRWTYRDLDRQAERLARRLRAEGVRAEARVAVSADRTPLLIAALLAVWRAGGAYVPLDPALPRERRAWILADSGARVLLGEARHLANLPEGGARRVVLDAADADDADAAEGGEEPRPNRPESWPAIWPENLAYLIYTSGSTGTPKGVAIEQRSAVALVAWAASAYSAAELDGVLAATSIGFDLSVFEIFVPLCLGGRVIVAESALALPKLPEAAEVRLVNTVPSVLAELLREGGVPPGVATINLAGEALRRELARALAADTAGTAARRLVNLYGPSEATTYSTWAEVELAGPDDGEPSIGRPIGNTQAHVLDRALRPLPVGVPGELCLGGAGLARGYLGRPELTAERFVPSPFAGCGEAAGARLYRTGDLARRRPDGDLQFLGRADDQVKIRGVRVEPGEVEAALLACPEVAAAAVAARRGPDGEPFLAAYVVPRGGRLAASRLREALRRRLPEVMVPAAFVPLSELPLGPTGKVDRRALAAMPTTAERAEREAGGAAPRTPLEAALAAVWAEVLGVDCVGVEDDFFDLGGHSLVAARLRARIAERLGVELPLGAFFRATTVARLAAVLEEAEAAPPSGAARAGVIDPPRPLPRDGRGFPLSFAQERLWLLERLRPGTAAYHLPGGVRLAGPLSPAALRRALAGLARRHEALRTRFPEEGGAAVQAIDPPAVPDIPELALDALPDPAGEAGRLAAAEAVRPFDLARGPLWRARLLRLGSQDHRLLLTLHHLIVDEASLAILVRELAELYAARALPPPPAVQAADLAVWQRERLQGEAVERELAWWAERLAGLPPLDLPADRPRPPVASARGDVAALRLPDSVAAGLGALARRAAATPFMALLAGFQALLGRIAETDDLAVGCPLSSRGDRGLEGVMGLFVDTLVLRADLAGDPGFGSLLARVREVTLAAHEHGGLPFELLVARLQPARAAGRNPLFDVALAQESPPVPRESAGLRIEPFAVPTGTAKFDLTLFATRFSTAAGDGTRLALEHSLDLFDRTTARRLLACLATLLAGAVADPARRLSALPLLADAERFQLLVEWGEGSPAATPSAAAGATVVSRLARQAMRRPRALAVRGGGREMTYGELDALSRRVAAQLRRLGVGEGSVVGVLLDRTPEMVAAFLAAMRAGAAYLPLDPSQPAERLAFLLTDARAAAVVTGGESALATAVLAASTIPALRLDDLSPGAEVDPGEPSPAGLAYVLYTSGSSGRPKGVEVDHRSLANLVDWHLGAYQVTPADRAAQTAAIGFDAAVWELWPYLAAGASVHLADESARLSPERLRDWLVEEEIDLAFLPTPLAEGVLALPWPPRTALRALLTGGDRLRRLAPPGLPFAVVNHYGPTEGTVVATAGAVPAANGQAERPPAIGRPIAGARVYVLDGGLAPAPLGVPGELCLGGAGVARGYRGRPNLTAERFLPDPFAGEPGARLYRTGDRVRFRAEGDLEFLGRLDQQVKVRGVRIEPGEIEAALAGHPAVGQAAVVLRGDGPGARLVAYWVAEGDHAAEAAHGADPAELRAYLQARLPEPMIPAVFVPLAALPLSAHGKLDRAALPDVDVAPGPRTPPRTPTERQVAAVWAEVLGHEEGSLAAEDDFFALGGHSLLAMRVVSRLGDACGVELPLRAAFDRPLLADLATAIDAAGASEAAPRGPADLAAPPLVRRGTRTAPLSFAQERLWFLDQLEPESPVYNLPAALRLAGALDPAALRRAIADVVARHEALRTTFRSVGGELVQEIGPPLPFTLPAIDLAGLGAPARAAEALRLARAEALRPFSLARGPLLRAALLLLARGEHALLWSVHHIVFDGWSLGVFLRDLGALYQPDAAADGAAGLPALPVQYGDFAAWQRERLGGAALDGQLAHWRERLAGAPAVVELPADRPRPPRASFRGGSRLLALDAATAAALRALARRAGATPFMVLLASFAALLGRLCGRRDLVVGAPTANRDRPELEPLIGFFADSLVLRLDLGADPAFGELLARVRASTLDAYAHRDVPFEKLVEALRPERDLSHNPLYQVVFALDGSERPGLALPGVAVSPLPVGSGTSKFDLALYMEDREGGLAGLLEYSRDLFDDTTAERFLAAFAALTSAACRDAGRRLAELPLLGDAERHRLLVELNDTERRPPEEPFVHRLIAARAAAAPGAPAVSQAGRTLAYGELDRRANQLAHRLRRLGVGPESRVAVALQRSPELVAAMLGIWKAGGAYVPLDLAYPPDRLAYMLESSRAAVLLTEAGLAETLPETAAVPLLLDPDWSALAGEPDGDLKPDPSDEPGFRLSSQNLAYVIYTSGSTGRPKGTMIEHGSFASYVATAVEAYGITAADRVLQFCSISFDISLEEIVPCLASGAELVLRTPEMIASIGAFLAACREQGVTMLSLPTAYWHEIVAKLDGEGLALPPSLRLVVIAGERALPERLLAWRRHAGARPRLVNTYGLTESTIISTVGELTGAAVDGVREAPIGRVIPDTEIYVLDGAFRPVPLGVPGEMFLGGGLLARGYLGRPDATAERFVPHPLSGGSLGARDLSGGSLGARGLSGGSPGARLYRTGDLARVLPDGELEFLGRGDHQVKIRGYRIELQEIEAALALHPDVEALAVAAPEERPGQRRLVAYVVSRRQPPPAAGDLRSFLARGLPEYMLPAAFAFLDALPMTPNGKVDRGALPPLSALALAAGKDYVPPRDEVEGAVAEIWRQALGVERVGIHDNFFDLGGHSLLLARVHEALAARFGVRLPMVDLFTHPTVDALARRLRQDAPATSPPERQDQLDARAARARAAVRAGPERVLAARRHVRQGSSE